MNGPATEIPPGVGYGVPLPTGEIVLVPAALSDAIGDGLAAAAASGDSETDWRTAFAADLVEALHGKALVLIPLSVSKTRNVVDANVYSMALTAKYEADRRVHAVSRLIGRLPEFGSLPHHVQDLIDALTGHAPPTRVAGLGAALDERLRALRQVVFGTEVDEPLQDPPAPPLDTTASLFARTEG